jgi:hypothetical protein
MNSWSLILRVTAIAILLLGGLDLVACEFVSADRCGLSGSSDEDDHCLSCCRHLFAAAPFVLTVTTEAPLPAIPPELKPPSRQPASIYHPPRA